MNGSRWGVRAYITYLSLPFFFSLTSSVSGLVLNPVLVTGVNSPQWPGGGGTAHCSRPSSGPPSPGMSCGHAATLLAHLLKSFLTSRTNAKKKQKTKPWIYFVYNWRFMRRVTWEDCRNIYFGYLNCYYLLPICTNGTMLFSYIRSR